MTTITVKDEIIYQSWREEEILNGYFHITQKSLNSKSGSVGIKSCHILYAESMNVPMMIHLCPIFKTNKKSIYKANYKDQESVMIIDPKDFHNLKHNSMSYKRDENNCIIYNDNKEPEIMRFPKWFTSKVKWINENFTEYEVWHYKWNPNYISRYGIINKSTNIDKYIIG